MKVWFNRISESRRSMLDLNGSEFSIGRDPENDIVLTSPLVSRQHAVVRFKGDQLELENLGINSCLVGDTEILGGQSASFTPGAKIRIWPFTLSFQTESASSFSQAEIAEKLKTSQQVIAYQLRKLKEQANKKGTDEVFNAALIGGLAGAAAGIGIVALLELLKNNKE